MEKVVEIDVIETILKLYGFTGNILEQKSYIRVIAEDGWKMKGSEQYGSCSFSGK